MSQFKKVLERRLFINGIYRRVFDNEDGKEVLFHLMKTGFVTKSTFVAGDPQQTALNEGSRRLVLSILAHIHKTPQEITREIENAYKDQHANL